MIKFETISTNNYIIDSNGEKVVDIYRSPVQINKFLNLLAIIRIDTNTEGKIWLISKLYYETENYTDLLMYFNGISNPYNVKIDDLIYIPKLDELRSILKAVEENTDNTLNIESNNKTNFDNNRISYSDKEKKYVNKLSKIDRNRFDLIKQKNLINNREFGSIPIPNNVSEDDNLLFEQGSIVLGNNISNSRCSNPLDDVQSKSQRIRKAIIKNINN